MTQDKEKSNDELMVEIKSLSEQVAKLQTKNCLTSEQKLKLAIFERVPLTIWACNRNFKIVLWSGNCEEIYGFSAEQALGKNYLELFVDPPEREESRKECLKIVEEDTVQKNFLAYDRAKDGSKKTILGHCFRIFDEENNEYLQAEVALEISDLQLSIDKHHTLREAGIDRLAWTMRTVELMKRELTNRIDIVHSTILNVIRSRRDELDKYFDKIRAKEGERAAHSVLDDNYQRLELTRCQLVDRCESVKNKINEAKSIEDLDGLIKEVDAIEAQDFFHGKTHYDNDVKNLGDSSPG